MNSNFRENVIIERTDETDLERDIAVQKLNLISRYEVLIRISEKIKIGTYGVIVIIYLSTVGFTRDFIWY